MNKGKLFAWLTVIGIGLWMGFSAIEALDAVAAKAREVSSLTTAQRE